MEVKGTARRIALSGRALVAASLFFVLIWWRASLYLFLAGAVVYALAWWLDRATTPTLLTAPE